MAVVRQVQALSRGRAEHVPAPSEDSRAVVREPQVSAGQIVPVVRGIPQERGRSRLNVELVEIGWREVVVRAVDVAPGRMEPSQHARVDGPAGMRRLLAGGQTDAAE